MSLRKILLAVVLTSLTIGIRPARVDAKDFSITSADFLVRLKSNGSADITETRTYQFDGSYSNAYIDFDTKAKCLPLSGACRDFIITNDSVDGYRKSSSSLPNTYYVQDSTGKHSISWHFQALDEP